ncbi:hypothetical protein DUI87_18709 [Hirundo rustica rustica]|uniref:Uncharacterized protein n=1 Tax=Hirundo rustica rustica TaxID=333673 RepID=A0A3M0JXI5_HIRRU|nr:hypothetical protein DUI87_18709 [Hirundo rustica rustica]
MTKGKSLPSVQGESRLYSAFLLWSCPYRGSSRKNYTGTDSVGKRCLRELVDIPGSLPLGSRMMSPNDKKLGAIVETANLAFKSLATVKADSSSLPLAQKSRYAFIRQDPADWKLVNVMSIYKKGQKDDLENYRPVKPNLGDGQGYGREYPEYCYMAHVGQPGDQAQPIWIYEGQVLLDKSDLLLQQSDPLSR